MMRSRLLALALTIVASSAAALTVRRAREVGVGPAPDTRGAVTQWEPTVAIDPLSPSHLVVAYQQDRGTEQRTINVATSYDAGRRWSSGSLPALTTVTGGPFTRATDSVVTFGADRAVYALTLGYDLPPACRSAITVQRSDDGGATFGDPSLVQDDRDCGRFIFFHNDKGWIAADASAASPRRGRLYVVWTQEYLPHFSTPVVLRFSDDKASTWSDLVTVSSTSTLAGGFGPIPLVQPNGDVTVIYNDFPLGGTSRFVAQTSHDGGLGFDAPVEVADDQSLEVPGLRTKGIDVTFMAAAVDPVRGDLFVVWQDGRLRSDGLNDIVLSRSTDGGEHWDSPRRVNVDAGKVRNHFTPVVAAYDGAVIVTFTTRDADGSWLQARASVSLDGGTTFRKPRRLGPHGDVRFALISSLGAPLASLGDYAGVAAGAKAAHAVWIRPSRPRDDSSGQHQTTWATRIGTRR
jgi:hypothetical protein